MSKDAKTPFEAAEQKAKVRGRPNQITVDLGPYREPFMALCGAGGVTPSQGMRQVVAKVLEGQGSAPHPVAVRHASPERASRTRKVNLTPSEWIEAERIAEREGMTIHRWIVALVRARIANEPQFAQTELNALTTSNAKLLAIGRNLNQIARALNMTPHDRSVYRPELVAELEATIREHTRSVSSLISANIERWRIQ